MLGLGFARPGPSVWSGGQWRRSQIYDGAKGIWPDGFNPYAGRVAQDVAGNLPAMLPGDPVGLIRRAAGSVDASQATALSRPILGRHPKGGRRNLLTNTEDLNTSSWANQNTTASGLSVRDTTSATSHIIRRATTGYAAGVYSVSFDVKAVGAVTSFNLLALPATGGSGSRRFNLLTGEVVGQLGAETLAGPDQITAVVSPDPYAAASAMGLTAVTTED